MTQIRSYTAYDHTMRVHIHLKLSLDMVKTNNDLDNMKLTL